MNKKPEYDICIIGGGAAGLVVAAGAASLGAKVVLIEKNKLGGDCLYYGCVPSKTLIHSAKVADTIRHAKRFGISGKLNPTRLSDVMQRVDAVIKQIEPNDSPERFQSMGVKIIFGSGQFTHERIFTVADNNITAKKFILTTGTSPAVPPIEGIEKTPFLTNESLFSITEDVDHLLVLGAGPIGCEISQSFIRLGAKVSLFDLSPRILPREDEDMSNIIVERFKQEGVESHLGIQVVRIEKRGQEIKVRLKSSTQIEYEITGSHLLVAAGRKPNIQNLGLEQANVQVEKGRLILDHRLRTSNKNIFACGDLAGPYLFTHIAEYQAGVVLRNALFHLPAKAEYRIVPWCTYTDPELARVGLSETEAKTKNIKHYVYRFPFTDIDRAITEGETYGSAKIITTAKGKLLGACIVGPHAGELIAEYVLALSKGMKLSDISSVIHIYPTLAQINRRVADQRLKESLTPTRKKWIKRIFGLRG